MVRQYVSIPNWAALQHYKERRAPWIKLYVDMLARYEFACLQDASKAHLLCIWMLAAEYDNRIPMDPAWVAKRIFATEPVDFAALIDAGFLVVTDETACNINAVQSASDLLAETVQSASRLLTSETERETEREYEHAGARAQDTALARGLAAGNALAATPEPDPLPADLEALAVALLDRIATLRHKNGRFAEVGKDLAGTRLLVEVSAGHNVRAMAREYPDACRELIPRALEQGDKFRLGKGLARPNCLSYLRAAVIGWTVGESTNGRAVVPPVGPPRGGYMVPEWGDSDA